MCVPLPPAVKIILHFLPLLQNDCAPSLCPEAPWSVIYRTIYPRAPSSPGPVSLILVVEADCGATKNVLQPVERSSMNKSTPTAFRCAPSGRSCWMEMEGYFRTAPPSAMQTERARRCKVFLFCSIAAGFLALRQCRRGNMHVRPDESGTLKASTRVQDGLK